MKVSEIEYDHDQLNGFGPNELYRKCHKELVEDFEAVYVDMMNIDLGEVDVESNVAQSWKSHKTSLLSCFISGHLNAFNPNSKFFVKFEVLSGSKEVKKDDPLAGLILPDHYRK